MEEQRIYSAGPPEDGAFLCLVPRNNIPHDYLHASDKWRLVSPKGLTWRKSTSFVVKDLVTEIRLFLAMKILSGYTTCLFIAIIKKEPIIRARY
jgi:hypothetical protein